MLQNLLTERFGLQLHRETKEVSGYVFVVAKGGMKLKEVTEKDRPQPAMTSVGRLTGNMTTAMIANSLAAHLRTGVTDGTWLSGTYLVNLKWHPQEGHLGATSGVVSDLPSIFTAVQEQLGLRLEAAKVPINLMVIDLSKNRRTGIAGDLRNESDPVHPLDRPRDFSENPAFV